MDEDTSDRQRQIVGRYDAEDVAAFDAIAAAMNARDGKAARWTRTQVARTATYLGLDILRERFLVPVHGPEGARSPSQKTGS